MEEFEQVKSINPGITLIEVMVSMIIFSVLISLSGQLIKNGMERPFAIDKVEPWLNLIQDTSIALQNIPNDSELLSFGPHSNPFPEIQTPGTLESLKLEWQSNSLDKAKTALFTATTIQGKIIEWKLFKKVP